MNKNEFLASLNAHLSVLPPEERNELMNDYETHFAFGLQNGKTEAEIVHELGNPEELAKEAIGDRQIPQQQVYWSDPRRPQQDPPATPTKTRGSFATVMVCIGLFFLDIIAIPFLISFWGFGVCFVLLAASGLISPVLLLLEYLMNGVFVPAKGFAVVALVGVGMLFIPVSRYAIQGLTHTSTSFITWNRKVLKGGEHR
ncbi:DUF1700 domain-containing protein [Paenibacillus sp. D2_2]|uniref:DUF1700 domain-containing protein n=1 Tax=Paenibacillus sp. D2_2 TaxID=3073092 RepID=UPI0028155684|nr:DUF1700 domain-containing protein [Paenibacillus sp. D2_2]WMT40752.1 DUF1700 domain-containing protein [Paenibacillus sp. D2_2]